MTLTGFGDGTKLEITLQNENLITQLDGEVVATVPDLITRVKLEDREPIGTESLGYGLRVAVLEMPTPKELKIPRAQEFISPAAFGYPEVAFTPMAGNLLD